MNSRKNESDFLHDTTSSSPNFKKGESLLRVEEFTKSFGLKLVHRGVSFQLKQGECLGLIGGSGQGKSVLLRSLIGLEKPDSGRIYYEGKEVTKYRESEWIELRKKVAYAFQGGALFDSMTVFENLAYPLREHTKMNSKQMRERILSLLDEFGLSGNEDLFPVSLSGGMQKRVGLARAIILEPEVVLYDEPTAGLDPYNTRVIEDLILHLKKKGKSSILVTHDLPAAFEVCDRIAMLYGGKVGEIDSVKNIRNNEQSKILAFSRGEIN